MPNPDIEAVTEIRITDAHVINVVLEEQRRTGEKLAARTAGRLICERQAIREVKPERAMAPAAAAVA